MIDNTDREFLYSFVIKNSSADLISSKLCFITKGTFSDPYKVMSSHLARTVNPDNVLFSRGKLNKNRLMEIVNSTAPDATIVIDNLSECIQFHDKGGMRLMNILMELFSTNRKFIISYDSEVLSKRFEVAPTDFYQSSGIGHFAYFKKLFSKRALGYTTDHSNSMLSPSLFLTHRDLSTTLKADLCIESILEKFFRPIYESTFNRFHNDKRTLAELFRMYSSGELGINMSRIIKNSCKGYCLDPPVIIYHFYHIVTSKLNGDLFHLRWDDESNSSYSLKGCYFLFHDEVTTSGESLRGPTRRVGKLITKSNELLNKTNVRI